MNTDNAYIAGFIEKAAEYGVTDPDQIEELYKTAQVAQIIQHPAFQAGVEKEAAERGIDKEALWPMLGLGAAGLGLGQMFTQRGRQRMGGFFGGLRNMFGGMGQNFRKGYGNYAKANPTQGQQLTTMQGRYDDLEAKNQELQDRFDKMDKAQGQGAADGAEGGAPAAGNVGGTPSPVASAPRFTPGLG